VEQAPGVDQLARHRDVDQAVARGVDRPAEEVGEPGPGALGGARQDQVAGRLHQDLGALRAGVRAAVEGLPERLVDPIDEGLEVDGALQELAVRALGKHRGSIAVSRRPARGRGPVWTTPSTSPAGRSSRATAGSG
jgi:hypothetical protein